MLKYISFGKGGYALRYSLVSHLLESSDQSFHIGVNQDGNQSVSDDTVFACSAASAITLEMEKTLMGITKAVLAQNMGKSCDQTYFYRPRVN